MDKKTNDVVLTCGIARDLLPLYLDGLTSPESAAALRPTWPPARTAGPLRAALETPPPRGGGIPGGPLRRGRGRTDGAPPQTEVAEKGAQADRPPGVAQSSGGHGGHSPADRRRNALLGLGDGYPSASKSTSKSTRSAPSGTAEAARSPACCSSGLWTRSTRASPLAAGATRASTP